MSAQVLGKVSCSPKGEWIENTQYEYLDIVTSDSCAYIGKAKVIPIGITLDNTDYWQLIAAKGDKGDTGVGIKSVVVSLDSISGLQRTYELIVTYTDDTEEACPFVVLDGNGIVNIQKVSTVDLVDTYEITMDNGTTKNFTVTNGEKGEQGEKGNVCFATFTINDNGILVVKYDAGYDGAVFSINNNGELEVSLS